nr:ABC transporter A family member 2 [Ipomoea batatas]
MYYAYSVVSRQLKVQSFRTRDEVDVWLFNNAMHCPGALHFIERNASVISYGLQTNSTPVAKRGIFEDPTFKLQIPLQLAAEHEIARSLIGDPNFSWFVSFKEFAHPAVQLFSAVGAAGPTFFLAIAMFSFVFQISALVTEKELKLRQVSPTLYFLLMKNISCIFSRIILIFFLPYLIYRL